VPALSLQLLGLLVFVPGGLVFALAYRGRRRPELLASVVLFCVFHVLFGYGASEVGLANRLVLGLRFYLPLLPVLAFAAGESAPRLWRGVLARAPARHRRALEAVGAAALGLWMAGVVAAAGLVPWTQQRWTDTQAEIRDAIHASLGPDDVVVTNQYATFKFLPWYEARFSEIDRSQIDAAGVARLARRWGEVTLVLLDRGDSEFWRRDARENAAFVASLRPPPELRVDRRFGEEHLRIWRVR
jgi:hypothetical protein